MNVDTFFKKFELFADAPNAVGKMRELVLDLAVRGMLLPQESNEGTATQLLSSIDEERSEHARYGVKRDRDQQFIAGLFSIPATWAWTQLGDIALQIQYGYTASSDAALTDIRMLRITDIQNNRVNWPSVPGCIIDSEQAERYLLSHNDILIARTGGTIGKSFLIPDAPVKSIFASYLIRIRPPRSMAARYLKIFLESPSYWKQLRAMSAGTGQPNVNGQALGRLELPLPPLAEQKRIVAKVDELMALCDRLEAQQQERETRHTALAHASLTRFADAPTPENLELLFHKAYEISPNSLRSSIFSLAEKGRLVPQDTNDEPAAAFVRRLETISGGELQDEETDACVDESWASFPIPHSWCWVRLGELVESMANGIYKPAKFNSETGTACIRMFNIQDGKIDRTTMKRLALDDSDIMQYQLVMGDILVNRVNSRELVGKAGIVDCADEPLVFEAMNIRVRLRERQQLPDYVNLILRTERIRTHFQTMAKQAVGQASVNQSQVASLAIPLPPLPEQKRIVAKVDQLMALVDQLEVQLAEARGKAAALLDAVVAELSVAA